MKKISFFIHSGAVFIFMHPDIKAEILFNWSYGVSRNNTHTFITIKKNKASFQLKYTPSFLFSKSESPVW